MITPMLPDGSVDYPGVRKLIDWHIDQGTDCIGVVGTTGESPTVSMAENCEIIRVSVEQAAGRVPIMAGCGSNCTAEAIELATFAKQVGADCQLQVVPYYNKPTQEGQYQHFKAIAEAVDLPMVLYNVPGRSVADMSVETALRLAQLPGVIGIKEATGNIDRAQWLIREAPKGFAIYSGDDPPPWPDVVWWPRQHQRDGQRCTAPDARTVYGAMAGDDKTAMAIQFRLLPLHKNLFVEANPIPVKWAMARLGHVWPDLAPAHDPSEPALARRRLKRRCVLLRCCRELLIFHAKDLCEPFLPIPAAWPDAGTGRLFDPRG
jgi:4-hydroxy-tetrahydrodipicolinate synthase